MLFNTNQKQCEACIARDLHIATLREEVESIRDENRKLTNHIFDLEKEHLELVQHLTGMRKDVPVTRGEFKTVPRQGSIQQKIARAEQQSYQEAGVINTKRKAEYDQRIASLINPEIEIAVQESGT